MSVKYNATLGIGWIVSKDKRTELLGTEESFLINEDDFISINAYEERYPMYFYGKIIARIDEGEFYEDVPIITALLEKEKMRETKIFGVPAGIHLFCEVH